ncbi:MAG: YihY/virulence factor BrkB family protein [Lachnospiraceae bacterium]
MMRWIQEIRALLKRISKARVDAYAAQSAFYLIMGFIPFIMLLLTLLQYTTVTKTDAMELLMQIFPVSFQGFLEDIVSEIYVKSTTVMSISVIAAVWACGRGVLAITNGLNSVNGLKETRNYLFRRIRSGFYVVILVLSIVLALVLFVFGNAVHDVLIELTSSKISGMLIGSVRRARSSL